jgi:uncharacterized protein
MLERGATLTAKVVEFCALLRREHAFNVGPGEAIDALRALEIAGVADRRRVAAALQSVCCSRPEELDPFARAFASFFTSKSLGVAQRRHARRERPESRDAPAEKRPVRIERRPEGESLAQAWQAMLARYSPATGATEAPAIPVEGRDAARRAADRIVTRLRLGRSLRWKPRRRGERFDLRRTLRACLRTGGDLIEMHALGHPLRNPRFVLLLDGSRSMSEHAPKMLQFAQALCTRSRRADVFLFSTELLDVTRRLRGVARTRSQRLEHLGEAWGGGTRIGASLTEFVRCHGGKLNDQTFVIVVSDGLDAGEIAQLQRAMRAIGRRSAAIGWVNPDSASAGYAPSARAMAAALPYVTTFTSLERIEALERLGRRVRIAASA